MTLHSMTGFGIAQKEFAAQRVSVEIKSLNSKSLDLRTKLPNSLQSKDLEIRKIINNTILRGKVDFVLNVESSEVGDYKINTRTFEQYLNQLREVAGNNGLEHGDLLYTITRLPNVIVPQESSVTEAQWQEILQTIQEAIDQFQTYRKEEGAVLEQDIKNRVQSIENLLVQTHQYEHERIEKVRQRIRQNLEQAQINVRLDENRFEQEVIYYLEKFDFSEEKTRLTQHCTYFLEEMTSDNPSKGNKLNFISQEMGREINTLGSKANAAEIQRIVIQMKDELEKIKEQLANIL